MYKFFLKNFYNHNIYRCVESGKSTIHKFNFVIINENIPFKPPLLGIDKGGF